MIYNKLFNIIIHIIDLYYIVTDFPMLPKMPIGHNFVSWSTVLKGLMLLP